MNDETRVRILRNRYAAFCKSAEKCREPSQPYDQFLEHMIISLQEKYEPMPGIPPEPIPPPEVPAGTYQKAPSNLPFFFLVILPLFSAGVFFIFVMTHLGLF